MTKKKTAWNKGKIVGQKKPFTPGEIKLIRERLEKAGKIKQLAVLNFGIDSALRSTDLRSVRLNDIKNSLGEYRTEFMFKQGKTEKGVEIKLSENTIESIKAYVAEYDISRGDILFDFSHPYHTILVKGWAKMIGLPREDYSTHSIRRTKPAYIYEETRDVAGIRKILGHKSVSSTSEYLGVDQKAAMDLSGKYQI